jgi:hypothetical protein
LFFFLPGKKPSIFDRRTQESALVVIRNDFPYNVSMNSGDLALEKKA